MTPRIDRAPSNAVHVWSEWVDERAANGVRPELLDDDEQARAARFHFERDRVRFVARRAFLRSVLARYLGIEPAMVRYRHTSAGKPELDPSCGVSFSTSHDDGLAVVAVASGRPVGIDVERLRPISDALDVAQHLYSRRECERLRSVEDSVRSEAFLRLWTRKEAYAKAVGLGLSMRFDELEVEDVDDGRAPRLRGSDASTPFSIANLRGHAGYVGSVAAAGAEIALEQAPPAANLS